MIMVFLMVVMVFLVMKSFTEQTGETDQHTFQSLRRSAYEGRLEQAVFYGEDRIDATVRLEDNTLEQWEAVPVPEYARETLGKIEDLVARGRLESISLEDMVARVSDGTWRVVDGYTLNDPPADSTGVYLQYMRGGESHWADVHRSSRTSDADTTALIQQIGTLGVNILPAPVGQEGMVGYEPASDMWTTLLLSMLPWLIFMGFILFVFTRQMRAAGGSGGIMSFGRSKARMVTPDQADVSFDQVAGVEEAKEEVQEIIQFLKDPKRFSRLGGRAPRGVLLVGHPGTGKTLLAKAIAGEASVPFFSISGSDFVEMFVGVGASRVRDLFSQAREHAPCVIFLDEIDAVGRKRGAGLGGGHDEREQTLNAILVEMDGFETDSGVIMIAATNRPDVLDKALLRPGRFDRQITLDLPDVRGREAILVVHAQKVKMSPDVDLSILARGTPMFSGAELEAVINEGALIATLKDKNHIELEDLEEARDKVRFGRQKKTRVMEEEDRRVTAFHEAGHAQVAVTLKGEVEPVHKVTIIPRGMALGSTMQLPEKDKYHHRKKELLAMLTVLYGGRVAEELYCDDISGGAANDIERATEIARQMVCNWGMNRSLGPMTLGETRGEVFLGDELVRSRNYSEVTSEAIDQEVRDILTECYDRARKILEDSKDSMHRIADALLEVETITGDEVVALADGATIEQLREADEEEIASDAPVETDGKKREADDLGDEFGSGPIPAPEPA